VAILATGPSLTRDDVELLRGRVKVIGVNDAYRLCDFLDAMWATDVSWWMKHEGVKSVTAPKWSVEHKTWKGRESRFPDVQRLKNTGSRGLEHDPAGIRHQSNSGGAAINLAVHYGVSRILLLGYDMGARKGQPSHFFGEHRGLARTQNYHPFIDAIGTMVAPLKALGVTVLNCTRGGALTCFPRADLRQALGVAEVAA